MGVGLKCSIPLGGTHLNLHDLMSVRVCQGKDVVVWVGRVKFGGSLSVQQIFFMSRKVQDHGVSCQTTTLKASLVLKDYKCQHTNSIKVVPAEDGQHYKIPSTGASVSKQSFNVMIKTTEVRYLDMKYIIQDRYVFEYNAFGVEQESQSYSPLSSFHQQPKIDDFLPDKSGKKENNKQRKVFFFQKRLTNGKPLVKRNTKNLPKNFFKGFLSYIQDHQFQQNSDKILKQLNVLGEGIKYNNILIQKLLSNSVIAPSFKYFLENHAEDWINKSKINDKRIHLDAIPIYLSLFQKFVYTQGDEYWSDQ